MAAKNATAAATLNAKECIGNHIPQFMKKLFTKQNITLGFIAVILLFFVLSFFAYQKINHTFPSHTVSSIVQRTDYVSYVGKNGQNALTILQKKTVVSQDHSGLVDTINGRKADAAKHEYWAFYVNGKLASVGPADYVTKDSDKIEWKISKY